MLPLFFLITLLPGALQIQAYTEDFLAKIPPVDFCLADAQKQQIFYYLFRSGCQTAAIVLNDDYILPEEDRKLPMKVLLHGFTSNVTSPWYKTMKRAYFKQGSHNIMYVDWSIAGNKSFAVSGANVKPVGEFVADFLVKLKVPPENIHVIGHSLGAHLAGFIGRNIQRQTGKKLGRITGTDPAGPAFENLGPEGRLSKYDAAFVDVIHTDAGYYGISKPVGHVDFYVNFGRRQPGCPSRDVDDNCSHARSNDYFTESISTKTLAKPARYTEAGEVELSNKGVEVVFGDQTPPTSRGLFYLKTNKSAPFLIPSSTKTRH